MSRTDELLASRLRWLEKAGVDRSRTVSKEACEGGCGVLGFIASEPMAGRHLHRPLLQMNNRGNGKGGGIAVAGCFPERPEHFALHIALLDPSSRAEVEKQFVEPVFDIADSQVLPHLDDHQDAGLSIRPPEVVRYFVRAKSDPLKQLMEETGLVDDPAAAEAELISRNSFNLNKTLYADGALKAFVLSHGRNLMILKGVGFAEEILRYYRLEDTLGLVWIGHQRYPTRGRVWHPGGAHPFAGLDEALVHNGDLANYSSIAEYLRQKGIEPLFLTDTEVAVLLFDLYNRVYGYSLEYIIEALAPSTERDFEMLPKDTQRIYRALRASHLHGSPDGPFFFIIARTLEAGATCQLVGITDTSMLRPQVFALHEGEVQIGMVASEKQAIDAFLEEVSASDERVAPVADHYWNARGGSHTDGGAFIFTSKTDDNGQFRLSCEDKFGRPVTGPRTREQPAYPVRFDNGSPPPAATADWPTVIEAGGPEAAHEQFRRRLPEWPMSELETALGQIVCWSAEQPANTELALEFLTLVLNQKTNTGRKKPAAVRAVAAAAINALLDQLPVVGDGGSGSARRIDLGSVGRLSPPPPGDARLALDASGMAMEGPQSPSRLLVRAVGLGWRRIVIYKTSGHRFIGCGLGPASDGIRIDVYGSSGDYLGSGIDGAEIHVHGDAQDQIGQILKSGRIVIHGNAGQTLLYGAKGGDVFVRGNTAGRPLINAVGNVRVVVNGTCLDYAAESFMAGATTDGGFLVINGLCNLEDGRVYGLETKYPGTNLFSLASGGCCYLNDPYFTVSEAQLNGARFVPFLQRDWNVLEPYLKESERLFGIHIRHDLLRVDGALRWPKEVFRKVIPATAPEPVE